MTRNERHIISDNIHKINIMSFAINGVKEVMENLGVEQYVIGGSVAAILYGINIERCPHDVDVIVPKGMSKYIECMVNHSRLYAQRKGTSSTDDEFNTKHFSFTAIGFPCNIDIIEDITGLEKFSSITPKIADLETLIAAKKHYHRYKDNVDLPLLEEALARRKSNQKSPKVSDADIDALETLKAKMEENV